MAPRYRVTLTVEERSELKALTRAATKTTGKRFLYARALLLCDRGPEGPGWTVARVAEALGVSARTIEHLKRRFVEQGLEFALERKRRVRPPRKVIFDGVFEARLVALACSQAPPGRKRWDPAPVGGESGGTGLGRAGVGDDGAADAKKNQLQPHRKKYWRIPPRGSAAFVARMEDVLEVYARPYDPRRPVVCMDETNKQLIGEVREPLPVEPGQPERVEHEYVRNGVAQIFVEVEPLTGRSHVEAGERRTRQDWARWIEGMLERRYPEAERVVLVLDNLNTHGIESLYATYEPRHARQLAQRLEIHYTPKHGSWLNIAEIELSALCGQCLDRRIPSLAGMQREIGAWVADRNQRQTEIDWQFKTEDARIKLKSLYPQL